MNRKTFTTCLAGWLGFGLAGLGQAQLAPAVPPQKPAAPAESVVEMSPFTVNTSQDVGYQAENTLAGSRLNARLRDTASSVAVFTKEFLDDLAITSMAQLLEYSVNSEVDTTTWTVAAEQNPSTTGEILLRRSFIRGLPASEGMDYFYSITNADPYRVSRFDDTRGANSILFGIAAPGGLLNQSSKVAVTHRDSANIRYGFGSSDHSRIEMDANKVLVKDKLAVSLAAVDQENGGWRQFDFQDKERMFGAVTFRPVRTLTFQAMGEIGKDSSAVVKSGPPAEQFLAWYDHRAVRGSEAVTVNPTTAAPNASLVAMGITTRNGTPGGQNRRVTFIENDGVIFDAIGTYLTGSYNNAAVRAPDGTPGRTGSTLVISDPTIYPRWGNAAGPGMFNQQSLHNYTLMADWQPINNLVVNIAKHYQQTTLITRMMAGADPTLRGDPNRTLGLSGATNPYAGRLYADAAWRGGHHYGQYRESRASASYSFDTRNKWLGRHRLAGSWANSTHTDINALSLLSLVGRPFDTVPNAANNRVTVRNYFTEGDYGTYRVGDWRRLPTKLNFGGKSYDVAFVNDAAGSTNSGFTQEPRKPAAPADIWKETWQGLVGVRGKRGWRRIRRQAIHRRALGAAI